MKKLIKKVTSVFVAAVMAASMVVSAGAANSSETDWSVQKSTAPGMPSNTPYYTSYTFKKPNNDNVTYNYFTSRCTSFSAGEDSDGNSAYVRYWCYIDDEDGKVYGSTGSKYHYQTSSSTGTKSSVNTQFKYGRYANVNYVIERNTTQAVSASMSGKYYFST